MQPANVQARRAVTIGAVLLLGPLVHAQWSADPAQNLLIADGASEQTQPKIHATADGGAYIAWFDNSGGGYDVRLQRLDADGVAQWAPNGVLLADRGFSSTQDWDLDVDGAGHALVTFRDDRFTGTQITATRVDPSGAQVWGDDGVQLTSTTDFVAAPKIAATSDGFVVVAWTQESDTRLQKLDADGAAQWKTDIVLTDTGGSSFSASDLDASDSGSVIIALVRGFFGATLHAQKISADGDPEWGEAPIAIFDGGALQIGNFPQFVTDGRGGAVFGWYGTGPLQCYVQHVLADGSEKLAHDGVTASTDATQIRVSPDVSYHAETDEIFLFWREQNAGQSQSGIYGQKFDTAGVRQWTDAGRVLVPLDPMERVQVRNLQYGDGAKVFWVETIAFGDQRVYGSRVNSDGDFLWADATPLMSSVMSSKSRLAVALSTSREGLLCWADGRDDGGDVYAQNVNRDGSLGPFVEGDLTGDGTVAVGDLLLLLAAWGSCPLPCPPICAADLDEDCEVGVVDLLVLLANWG